MLPVGIGLPSLDGRYQVVDTPAAFPGDPSSPSSVLPLICMKLTITIAKLHHNLTKSTLVESSGNFSDKKN
jgi:hypothetical protein